ncbi:MAG: hypothetical protein WCZ90_04325 [Melioribacteraceae bacterium]
METKSIDYNSVLNIFLERWSIEKIESMTLNQYVDIRNKDTFCQWVENRTKAVGNINSAQGSIKFGIYKRYNPKIIPNKYKNNPRYKHDSKYSWFSKYGENCEKAFDNVKKDLKKIIEFSLSGKFELIDEITLPNLFKWKVAYLYSNNRLVFIFKRDVLIEIAKHFDSTVDSEAEYSKLYSIIVENKPIHKTIAEYTNELWDKFKPAKIESKKANNKPKRRERKETSKTKNTSDSNRKGSEPSIVTHKHDKIQEALRKKLIDKFGITAVNMEKNFIDIKLELPNEIVFYEVKSSSYASECIKEALGQVLLYLHDYKSNKIKKIVVVGNYRPNEDEIKYINFIKENIQIPFDYEFMNIPV